MDISKSKLLHTKLTVFHNAFFCKHYLPLFFKENLEIWESNLLHTKKIYFMKECIFKNVCILSLCNFITSFFLLRTFIFIYPIYLGKGESKLIHTKLTVFFANSISNYFLKNNLKCGNQIYCTLKKHVL